MVTENTAPNAAADVEMSQYVADRTRVNEDKIKQDDEIISQFGDYSYGWHDSDAAGEAAKRGIFFLGHACNLIIRVHRHVKLLEI